VLDRRDVCLGGPTGVRARPLVRSSTRAGLGRCARAGRRPRRGPPLWTTPVDNDSGCPHLRLDVVVDDGIEADSPTRTAAPTRSAVVGRRAGPHPGSLERDRAVTRRGPSSPDRTASPHCVDVPRSRRPVRLAWSGRTTACRADVDLTDRTRLQSRPTSPTLTARFPAGVHHHRRAGSRRTRPCRHRHPLLGRHPTSFL
jgi:hypothetical protein